MAPHAPSLRSSRIHLLAIPLVALLANGCQSPEHGANTRRDSIAASRATVAFRTDRGTSGWLPLLRPTKPVLRGRCAATDVDVLLDSGAAITVIDDRLADHLGLARTGKGRARGASGLSAGMSFVSGLNVQLGDLTLRNVPAIATDLGAATRPGQANPIVIIGVQVFHSVVVDIDYRQRRAQLRQPDLDRPADARTVPLRFLADGRAIVDVAIEANEARELLLDTGADGWIDLFAPTARELGVLARASRNATVAGIGGTALTSRITLERASLSGLSFDDLRCDILPSETEQVSGLVGSRLFTDRRVVIDFAQQRMLTW